MGILLQTVLYNLNNGWGLLSILIVIQGDSKVDLNFRPQIQVCNIILLKSNCIWFSSDEKSNLTHFDREWGMKLFLQATLVSVDLGIVQTLICTGSLVWCFLGTLLLSRLGIFLSRVSLVRCIMPALHQRPCHFLRASQNPGVSPPLQPHSSLGKPLNSKASTSLPMSQGAQIFRGKIRQVKTSLQAVSMFGLYNPLLK